MRLKNADRAIISEAKLRLYLLRADHPENKGKARLFAALGYTQANWQQLEADLRVQHLTKDAIAGPVNNLGRKWRIEAILQGPSGGARIRSVWMIYFRRDEPYFLTAYRLKR